MSALAPQTASETQAKLFEPFKMREVTLKNRIVVSPMSLYSSLEGFCDDFHLVHLGRFALGGAGLVIMEASAVRREGRITHGCNGIWLDEHVPGLRRITEFLSRCGSLSGIQLGHSGPKGSAQRPWHGNGALGEVDAAERGEHPWPLLSSSAYPFDEGWETPEAWTEADLDALVLDYRRAARRAHQAGFDVLEIHCAHGYLLHSFLSPLVNKRNDSYGGTIQNRMRLPLHIAQAVRSEWPESKPLIVRISSVDGVGIGWSIEDSVTFCSALAAMGIDAIACSSGGPKMPKGHALVARDPGFQVPFAARIRHEAGLPTIAVGLIREPRQAEDVLQAGYADLIALGRELLVNPNWPVQAALDLKGSAGWKEWPDQYAWWLERRARVLDTKRSTKS